MLPALSYLQNDINILTGVLVEFGKLVYMFHCVTAVGDTEAKLKIKTLEYTVTEIVFLNHTELVHWLASNHKLHTATYNSK